MLVLAVVAVLLLEIKTKTNLENSSKSQSFHVFVFTVTEDDCKSVSLKMQIVFRKSLFFPACTTNIKTNVFTPKKK